VPDWFGLSRNAEASAMIEFSVIIFGALLWDAGATKLFFARAGHGIMRSRAVQIITFLVIVLIPVFAVGWAAQRCLHTSGVTTQRLIALLGPLPTLAFAAWNSRYRG